MSQTSPLDAVIRRVPQPPPANRLIDGEVLVTLDAKKGVPAANRGLFSFGRDLRYFVVSTLAEVDCAGPVIKISDRERETSLSAAISYSACCVPSGAETLAVSFLNEDNLIAHLNLRIGNWSHAWITQRVNDGLDPFRQFRELRSGLLENLQREGRKLGLDLKLRLKPVHEAQAKQIRTDPFTLRVRDSLEEISAQLELRLEVEDECALLAAARDDRGTELEDQLKEQTIRTLLGEVTLHQLAVAAGTEVRSILERSLGGVAAEYGRRITFLHLNAQMATRPEVSQTIEWPLSCTIRDSSKPVQVQHNLLLQLVNIGNWQRAPYSDLRAWCRERVETITRSKLFGCNFVDLLLGFDEIESAIKQEVQVAANEIGYDVQQHLVVPHLTQLELTRGFAFTIEGKFRTGDSRLEVELEIFVNGRIPNLRKIETLLRPEVSIVEEMKSAAQREVETAMHGISPQSYYTAFSETGGAEGQSVEGRLRHAVQVILENRFTAEVLNVIPKPKLDALTTRRRDLCGKIYEFEVTADPVGSKGHGESVSISGLYQIRGVSNWWTFYSQAYGSLEEERGAIQAVLTESLRHNLALLPRSYLEFSNPSERQLILTHIAQGAIEQVGYTFGVAVTIVSFGRDLTGFERSRKLHEADTVDQALKAESEGLTLALRADREQFQQLLDKRQEYLAEGSMPTDDHMRDLERSLKKLLPQLTHRKAVHGAQLIAGTPPPEMEPDWEAFRRLLPGRSNQLSASKASGELPESIEEVLPFEQDQEG
jgi:hypothetical protein